MASNSPSADAVVEMPVRLRPVAAAAPAPAAQVSSAEPRLTVRDLSMSYGGSHLSLENISLDINTNHITAFIGPSGCGKSTLLRCLNRLNDLIDGATVTGKITLDGVDIYDPSLDVTDLRRRIGMVFQRSNPFPKSIFDNVAYGPRLVSRVDKRKLDEIVERSLRQAALWDEVKDRLHSSALGMSGGQQQRLCIARALAVEPEVILMDEPCSALDPIATAKVEALIHELKAKYTIVVVTHNMQQAARVSDSTAFLYLGRLIEFGPTSKIFTAPDRKETEDYITGRFG